MADTGLANTYLSLRLKGTTLGIVVVLLIPTFYAVWYVFSQANGAEGLLSNLDAIDTAPNANGEFQESLTFTLLLATLSSTVAALTALVAAVLLVEYSMSKTAGRKMDNTWFEILVAIPHAAWAASIFIWLSQSGVFARISFWLGIIENPAGFPTLVRDSNGLGLFIHYVTKEFSFMILVFTVVLWARYRYFSPVAASLGAGIIYRARYIAWPLLRPATLGVWLVSFSFILHSFEAPALLGAVKPRVLSVLVLELFKDPTVEKRATAALIGVLLLIITLLAALLGLLFIWKSMRQMSDREVQNISGSEIANAQS